LCPLITPPLFDAALPLQRASASCGVGYGIERICPADAAPFTHKTPCPKQIELHVHSVIAVHMLRVVDAIEAAVSAVLVRISDC
jgi:hypothetical protein